MAPTSVLSGAGGAATRWNGAATERASSTARHVREGGERDGATFACPRAGREWRGPPLHGAPAPEEPVEADVVEQVPKDLSRALDQADPVPGSYTLEVSTPGLSRPLHTSRDFRRQRGHEVSIVRDAGDGAPEDAGDGRGSAAGSAPGLGGGAGGGVVGGVCGPVRGLVVDADEEAVVLEVGGSQVRVPLSEVVRGKVVLP